MKIKRKMDKKKIIIKIEFEITILKIFLRDKESIFNGIISSLIAYIIVNLIDTILL